MDPINAACQSMLLIEGGLNIGDIACGDMVPARRTKGRGAPRRLQRPICRLVHGVANARCTESIARKSAMKRSVI
jgi:hypothetical protein